MSPGTGSPDLGRRVPNSSVARLTILLLAISLLAGVCLRTVRLDSVPPGLHHDEACNGYDAYSILKTGRDQHGNFLPLLVQAFNDYRLPLFDYSLVPLIGALGLKPAVVRLGAAIWGSVDLVAITILAGLMFGLPGATVAALLGALSPWHLPFSRFGAEYITASTTASLAMVSFFAWRKWRSDRWVLASGAFFGLSLYSYSIAKPFTPLMISLLAILYWRELKGVRRIALWALGIVLLLALPQAVVLWLHPGEILAQAQRYSLLHYLAVCRGCPVEEAAAMDRSLLWRLENLCAGWISYFTPSYLFSTGDRGDQWLLIRLPGFGQLLPEQALLVLLGLAALSSARRRSLAILLLGWLIIATLPAALTTPPGIWHPEANELRRVPTAEILITEPLFNHPLTPARLLSHPSARRDLLAITPWILLSALGFDILLGLTSRRAALKAATVGLLLAGVIFHGVRFASSYFRDYPIVAAPFFHYGMSQVVQAIDKLDDGRGPVIITSRVSMSYIYVLFFKRYPPALFQRQSVTYGKGVSPPPVSLHAPVIAFDHYFFVDPWVAYPKVRRGILVFPEVEELPEPPTLTILYPDGRTAYYIIVKRTRG